jgi:hypothetical protein
MFGSFSIYSPTLQLSRITQYLQSRSGAPARPLYQSHGKCLHCLRFCIIFFPYAWFSRIIVKTLKICDLSHFVNVTASLWYLRALFSILQLFLCVKTSFNAGCSVSVRFLASKIREPHFWHFRQFDFGNGFVSLPHIRQLSIFAPSYFESLLSLPESFTTSHIPTSRELILGSI